MRIECGLLTFSQLTTEKRILAHNTSKMLHNLSFKSNDIYKGTFHIKNYFQEELCEETYDFKTHKNMKLINLHGRKKFKNCPMLERQAKK